MRKFQRAPEPAFLTPVWEQWGIEWEARKRANPSASWNWRQVDGDPVNHKLLPLLKEQTQKHCSFCDAFPVSPPSIDTIEHFRPKGRFPREAYQWTNLYFCCTYCQQKNDSHEELCLRPDAKDYRFEDYFLWDYTRGTLEVRPGLTGESRQRALTTISLYRLNDGHPLQRKRELYLRSGAPEADLDDFAYRDFVGSPSLQG